ncbi:hypothetical protein CYMTET_49484 [Cymbomonas tetramitiformis]|uniref:RING-CH-type domain-containing protein n=1 Tax=Cymbomonas tetramitiformis TaxID=36881 RepID=A0AAE0BRG0_9CHLO|nr:hypothetical protein CYMTET_49484 [Cymbomonas tetramitiformis]
MESMGTAAAEMRRRSLLTRQRQIPDDDDQQEVARQARLRNLGLRASSSPRDAATEGECEGAPAGPTGAPAAATPREIPQLSAQVADCFCRICHTGENSDMGRLFSPCLCRGTVGKVHLQCLNSWRRLSSNPHSYYRCDQCLYDYNLQRADFATVIESPTVVTSVTLILLVVLVVLSPVVFHFLGLDLAEHFTQLVKWTPQWKGWVLYAPRVVAALDWLLCGCVVVGFSSFVILNVHNYRRDPQQFYRYVGPGILCYFAQYGAPILRVFVALGFGASYQHLYHWLHETAKQLCMKFGEIVLEVTEHQNE